MEKVDQKFQRLKRKIEEQERRIFHKHFSIDEVDLYSELSLHKTQIDKLLKEKIIKKQQYDLILPSNKRTNSKALDHTILHVLLRNLCGYTKPSTGWDKEPKKNDTTEIAHLIRLKIGRNEISHLGISKINNKNYKKVYKYLKKPLLSLGCNLTELNELIPKPTRFKYTPAVPDFAFRDKEIEELDQAIQYSLNTPGVIAVAISGFAGTGKTQLVKKYFDTNSKSFDHAIVWINAASLEESFLELAKTVQIATIDQNNQEKDIDVIINELHQYFQDDRILFVFDNVEVPSDEEKDDKLMKFIHKGPKISTIITSQTEIHWQQIKQLKLKEWKIEDAVQFINERIQGDHSEIKEIVQFVDCNTFAIRQFISHCQGTRTSLHDYLRLLKNKPKSLSSQTKVYNAMNISIDRLESINPEALNLLQSMIFLDGKDIKRGLFISKYQGNDIDSIESRTKINKSLRVLESCSLIDILENDNSCLKDVISVHSLIQETLKLFPRQNQTLTDILSDNVHLLFGNEKLTEDELSLSDFAFFDYSYKHLIFIYNSIKGYRFRSAVLKTCSFQLDRLVSIFHFKGRLKFAIDLLSEIKESNLFKEDVRTLLQLESCIGYAQYHRRNFMAAYKILSNISERQKNLLGERHPEYLKTALGYTRCLGFLEMYNEGLQKSKELYELHCEVLGDCNPQTLICRRVIGINLFYKGELTQSNEIYTEVLREQINNHGTIHPEVCITRMDYIIKQKDLKFIITELKDLLCNLESLYGGEHLMLAMAQFNLAVWLANDRQSDEAYEYAKAAFHNYSNEYDEDHVDVVNTEVLLYSLLGDYGNNFDNLVKRKGKLLGHQHPEVRWMARTAFFIRWSDYIFLMLTFVTYFILYFTGLYDRAAYLIFLCYNFFVNLF